jgi:hypothetical protein
VPLYGIVRSDSFIPLTIPSSWGEFSPRYDTALSDYPQEQGAYAVYNKVVRPRTIEVVLVKTGSDVARFTWLSAIEVQESGNPEQLYTLISPQGIYTDYTIAGLSYVTRKEKGSNMLYLSIRFQEIPQITNTLGGYLNVLEAKSGIVAGIGNVFSSAATTAQNAAVSAGNFLGI